MMAATGGAMPSKPPMPPASPRTVPDKMPMPKPPAMPPGMPPKGMLSAMATNPDAPSGGGYSPGVPSSPSVRTVPDKTTITPSSQPGWPSKAPATSTPGTKPDDKI